MSEAALLELRDISCLRDGKPIFSHVNITVNQGESASCSRVATLTFAAGDILVLRGKSGSGKTTLLKCIAHLVLYDGEVLYCGSTPKAFGVPSFRTRVLYVPQRPSMLPGTPRDFLTTITALEAHKAHAHALKKDHKPPHDPFARALHISRAWDVDPQLWGREWANLSEPTSALDSASTIAVEKLLLDEIRSSATTLKAMVWITHSDEQGSRIGNKFVQISAGGCVEEPIPLV
ncbi:hypothetical protein H0H81_009845 [Sphagnurus paluster]|uniref:ABC transporter domain-containing protein n=1 Tax=Sphagnurus paluster TaxID=117069 RepID=A0A9P7FW32_9AGAR|nr:hypothetical protein H0H81_009845 [Sphagnurus paluster]